MLYETSSNKLTECADKKGSCGKTTKFYYAGYVLFYLIFQYFQKFYQNFKFLIVPWSMKGDYEKSVILGAQRFAFFFV